MDQQRLSLRKLRLDRGGYAPDGTYYGVAMRGAQDSGHVYQARDEAGELQVECRAWTRAEAIRKVRDYPSLKDARIRA